MGVPTRTRMRKLLNPSPKSDMPMPLMPCSACMVTLITAMKRPMSAPVLKATSSPSHGLAPFSTA